MKVQLQRAWVLHTRPYRDSSMLVELLTPEYGRMSLVARGARGGRSRGGSQAALLQPFQPLLCSWSGRSNLKTLTGVETRAMAVGLQGERLFSALYVNELLVRLLHHEDPHPRLYEEYHGVLEELSGADDVELALRNFEFRLLEELGYGFDLTLDGLSGDPVREQGRYSLQAEYGLVELPADRPDNGALAVFHGEELLQIARGEFTPQARRCAKALMRAALAPHLGEKPLRARELFRKPG